MEWADKRHPEPRLRMVAPLDFGSPAYWDMRYEKIRKEKGVESAYEWYCDIKTAESHLEMVFLEFKNPKILVVGCGNSELSEHMYNNGFTDVTNIDFSAVCIHNMKKRCVECEGMQFYVADVTHMQRFPDCSFDVVIDKGCIDCVYCVGDGARGAIRAYKEVFRVLVPKGRFISYSASGPNARKRHLEAPGLLWDVEATFVGSLASCYLYVCRIGRRKTPKKKKGHKKQYTLDDGTPGAGGAGAGAGAGVVIEIDEDKIVPVPGQTMEEAKEAALRRAIAERRQAMTISKGAGPPKRGEIGAQSQNIDVTMV